jgi:hypothetical protein
MSWVVELTDEFNGWWDALDPDEQESVGSVVDMLESQGPTLPFPYSSGIKSSKHGHMRELRIQHQGRPYRVLYAFDPRRAAIMLLGGEKTGDGNRWYEAAVPQADRLYDEHLETLKREGEI